jgi:hypothetical protein
VAWDAVPSADEYRVSYNGGTESAVTGNSFVINNLTAGSDVSVSVKTKQNGVESTAATFSFASIDAGNTTWNAVWNNATVELADNTTLNIPSGTTATIKTLIFNKNVSQSSQVFNAGTIQITDSVKVRVSFPDDDRWQFVSFPFAISRIVKNDGSLAEKGTDYYLGQYNSAARAAGNSGWELANSETYPAAGKAYIISASSELLVFEAYGPSSTGAFSIESNNVALDYPSTVNGKEVNFGWNFIAHPLSANASVSINAGDFIYVYDYSSDQYQVSAVAVQTSIFDSYFIKTSQSGETVHFSASPPTPSPVKRKAAGNENTVLPLYLQYNENLYKTQIRINESASSGYDALYDAPYNKPMLSATPQFYSLIENSEFAVNTLPAGANLMLGMKLPEGGNYKILWDKSLLDNAEEMTLLDNTEQTETTMRTAESYEFIAAASGVVNNRFSVRISPGTVTGSSISDDTKGIQVFSMGKNIEISGLETGGHIRIYDMYGRLINKSVTCGSSISLPLASSGVYVVEAGGQRIKAVVE